MTKSTNQLEPWEVSLIKAMLESKKYKKQEIVAFFSRPDRSINQARISEIEDGHDRYSDTPIAPDFSLKRFLSEWEEISFPGAPSTLLSPTHPDVLARKFQKRASAPLRLNISETSEIEGKKSFDWGSRVKYCRTLAGMANNNGGYLLFGVLDGSFEVIGIKEDRMEKFDLAKANQFIARTFDQSLRLEKGQFEIEEKTVGVLYVHPADQKPVICKTSSKDLDSGDIYFRYPGETRRIQEPELKRLLSDAEKQVENRLLGMMAKIGEAGAENSAVLDLLSGEVSGQSGAFVIDESLLHKVKFVSKGQFTEKIGAPTLRLVGDVQPVGAPRGAIRQEVIASVTEKDIQRAFLEQQCEFDPKTYIRAQPNLQPKWFPVFYFAKEAKIDGKGLVETLQKAATDYPARTAKQVERVVTKALPAGPPHPRSVAKELEVIYSREPPQIESTTDAHGFLKAVRIIDPKEVEFDRVLSVLKEMWMRFGDNVELRSSFRNAITSVDTTYFGSGFFSKT